MFLRAHYIPSWNGDLRLETDPEDPQRTILTIEKPTEDEKKLLAKIGAECVRRGWAEEKALAPRWRLTRRAILTAPIATVAPVVAEIARPGPAVLTALRLAEGKVITITGSDVGKFLVEGTGGGPYREPAPSAEAKPEKPPEPEKPAVAATVKRPTPSCPQCTVGAVGPASEVLLSFLNEEEHARWARDRFLVVEGGTSGHRYVLAHRNTPLAARIGRICYDLDEEKVVHFHDNTVPPEEEVLAAKLILEHREPWLRNEATALGHRTDVYKNPFGDSGDGVADSQFTAQVGRAALGFLKAFAVR